MARAIWKGEIAFGLVSVPVSLHGAEQRTDISFRLLDTRDKARIRYLRVNDVTGEEVPWGKVAKGYEGAIDPIYDDKPYYLVPEKRGARGYALLRETMRRVKPRRKGA